MDLPPAPSEPLELELRLVDAGERDLSELASLRLLASAEVGDHRGGRLLLDDLERISRSETPEDRAAKVRFLARLGGTPAGFGSMVPVLPGGTARVEELFVVPELRSIGIGHRLLEAMIEEALRQGCGGIEAVALPGDRQTKNFFEAHGMTARAITVHAPLEPRDG